MKIKLKRMILLYYEYKIIHKFINFNYHELMVLNINGGTSQSKVTGIHSKFSEWKNL